MNLSTEQLDAIKLVTETAAHLGCRACLVGGVVRDIIRGQHAHDFDLDFLIEGDAIRFASEIQQKLGGQLKKFPDFYTAKLTEFSKDPTLKELDFASTRTEVYQTPGALPKVALASLEADLKRRDFTTNAMAIELRSILTWLSSQADPVELRKDVIDFYGGLSDLDNHLIRVLHKESFIDDPTRLFRAIRYCCRLSGEFSSETANLFEEALKSNSIERISDFRVGMELKKMFFEDDPSTVFEVAKNLGLLQKIRFLDQGRLSLFISQLQFIPKLLSTQKVSQLDLFQIIISKFAAEDPVKLMLSFGYGKKRSLSIQEGLVQSLNSNSGQEAVRTQIINRGLNGEISADELKTLLSALENK